MQKRLFGIWLLAFLFLAVHKPHVSFWHPMGQAYAREELLRFEKFRADEPLWAALSAPPLELSVVSLDAAWESRDNQSAALLDFVNGHITNRYPSINDYEILFRACRLVYYVANYVLKKDERDQKIKLFQLAIDVGEKARKIDPRRVEAHYWTALSMGMWGLQRGILTSLGKASDMKTAIDAAVDINPNYEHAGPLRVRGRLFFKLPGRPLSFGDNKKAWADLQKATELGPDHPLNFAYLAEVQAKVVDTPTALKTLKAARVTPGLQLGAREWDLAKKEIEELENKLN